MKKYMTHSFLWAKIPIELVEVERETAASVWINGRRTAKRSDFRNYFDTWEEARDFLLDNAKRKINVLRRQLEGATGNFGNIKGLKKP